MRIGRRRDNRARLRSQLEVNRDRIFHSLNTAPDDVDGREPLWRERHRLLDQLESY